MLPATACRDTDVTPDEVRAALHATGVAPAAYRGQMSEVDANEADVIEQRQPAVPSAGDAEQVGAVGDAPATDADVLEQSAPAVDGDDDEEYPAAQGREDDRA